MTIKKRDAVERYEKRNGKRKTMLMKESEDDTDEKIYRILLFKESVLSK